MSTAGADRILSSLNEQQLAAVTYPDGQVLVNAGPGSGKTRVIVHRIAHLMEHRRVPPRRILAVTFTKKAANEMKERLTKLMGNRAAAVWAGTVRSWQRRGAPLLTRGRSSTASHAGCCVLMGRKWG